MTPYKRQAGFWLKKQVQTRAEVLNTLWWFHPMNPGPGKQSGD
jgi:hypothetical protein